jgi:hypothetical protein
MQHSVAPSHRRSARRRGLAALALCVCAASLVAPSRANAQSAGDANEARSLFERGVALIDQQQFAAAIELLEQSQRLRPSPSVTYNLGLALRGVGRLQESIAAFERYLAQPSRSATAEEVAQVRAIANTLRASLAQLELQVEPAGALVRIDSAPARAVTGPIVLDPGTHAIEVTAQHHVGERRTVSLAARARVALSIALRPTPAVATLVVEPSVLQANVWIDGQLVGAGAVTRELAAGEHRVRVQCGECTNAERTVRLERGQTLRLQVDVSRRAGVSPVVIGVGVGAGIAAVAAAITIGVVVASAPAAPYNGEFSQNPGVWGGNHAFKRSEQR